MGRTPCCDKTKVKRGPWSPEEDSILKNYLHSHGTGGNWIALPNKAGLKRCGKSCRLRWLNYLRPDIKHGSFTDEEDNIILNLYLNIGSRWSVIASKLQGRTDNDVKNYWNTKMKKKLVASQRGNTNWNVSRDNNNSTISPKVEEADDEDYGNKDYPVVNSTTLISNTAETNSKEQEVLGSTPFSILSWLMEDEEEGTSTLPLTSWLMEDEEEGTSTLPLTSSTTFNTVPSSSHENTPILSPSFSLENGDYGYYEGELGFLDGFDFQEEISELGIDHQANSNCSSSSSSSLANFSSYDAPQLGWYQNVINY